MNEYIFTNEYEATETAISLNNDIKKVGEIDEGQEVV